MPPPSPRGSTVVICPRSPYGAPVALPSSPSQFARRKSPGDDEAVLGDAHPVDVAERVDAHPLERLERVSPALARGEALEQQLAQG